MNSKVAILIATAIIASVLAAGCTSQLSSNQSASQSTATGRDKVVQAVIEDEKQAYVNATWTRQVRNSTQWLNDTTAMVTFTIGISNGTFQYTAKYQKFGSASQASDYISSINHGYNTTNAQELINLPPLTPASSLNTHQNYQQVTNSTPTTNSFIKLLREQPIEADYIVQVNEVVITYHATYSAGPTQ
jgi:outer membrane murein-binding lipoprotein Lpp